MEVTNTKNQEKEEIKDPKNVEGTEDSSDDKGSKSKNSDCGLLSKQVYDALVDQIAHELYNHNLYRTFAIYFASKSLVVLEKYYLLRAAEELEHHTWIYNYLSASGCYVPYPAIEAIDVDIDNEVTPFEITVAQEIETTACLYDIMEMAQEEKDWMTVNFLQGDDPRYGSLIKEQLEEEGISNSALDIANTEDSWYVKSLAIMRTYDTNNPE